jgi:chlorophyll/bacteriochlorophyll a synthase
MPRPQTGVLDPPASLPAVLELLKPITWFPPMWAFGCGAVSVGVPLGEAWPKLLAGLVLAGPLVCATSQAANDWFDRDVDAINEPLRPIPSGRLPGRMGLHVAIAWTALSGLVAMSLGPLGFGAAILGLALAWAYSAPPLRLKRNGWWGNAACAACYEGLPWFTGAALLAATLPGTPVLVAAALYSAGAHGIMTLNDFKSIEGDRITGIRSLPVQLGVDRAGRVACAFMLLPQLLMVLLLLGWSLPAHAAVVTALVVAQAWMMRRFLRSPRAHALWYSAFGVPLFVAGMLVVAFGLRTLAP